MKSYFPSKQWIKENIPDPNLPSNTPDLIWLEGAQWRLVFLYDELMKNRRLYEELIGKDSVCLSNAFTKGTGLALWKKRLGEESFPIALEGADKIPAQRGISSVRLSKMGPKELSKGILGRIKGEVFAVPVPVLKKLDNHYENGLLFNRERVRVLVPYHLQYSSQTIDHNELILEVRVWMYVGIKEHWSKELDGGYLYQPVGAYAPHVNWVDGHRIGVYYYYSKQEDGSNY